MSLEAGLLSVSIDDAGETALHQQLFCSIRQGMLEGRLRPGQRLPSTRALARDLGVARGTVVLAYERLLSEGYLESRVGAGTHVAAALPECLLRPSNGHPPTAPQGTRTTAKRAARIADVAQAFQPTGQIRPFRAGLGPIDHFPTEAWARLAAEALRMTPDISLGYGDARGYGPLREAIAAYLGTARGVACTPAQVIVTTGFQQAAFLASWVLLDPGQSGWVEAPGYTGFAAALTAAGGQVVPVPVDEEGLDVEAGKARCRSARLACVTPAYQYPMGVSLSLTRRAALLEWARQESAWILEDDYDGEYRYAGAPLSTLHALDGGYRVLYAGTFAKVLAPALRVGYLVVPPDLIPTFTRAKETLDRGSALLTQAVLALFIDSGKFGHHLRRMRRLAEARRDTLVAALASEDVLTTTCPPAGLHLVAKLPEGIDAADVAAAARGLGITARPLSAFQHDAEAPSGLVLGFAAYREGQLRYAARRLSDLVRQGI